MFGSGLPTVAKQPESLGQRCLACRVTQAEAQPLKRELVLSCLSQYSGADGCAKLLFAKLLVRVYRHSKLLVSQPRAAVINASSRKPRSMSSCLFRA